MKTPTEGQMSVAVAWLEMNEGEGEERAACLAVARWLDHLSRENYLRRAARSAGLPVASLRERLAQQTAPNTYR